MKRSVQHMQLWTNEANSATSALSSSRSGSLAASSLVDTLHSAEGENEISQSHSSTYSPTISNSSATSSSYLKTQEKNKSLNKQNDKSSPNSEEHPNLMSVSPKSASTLSGLENLAAAAAAVIDSMNEDEEDLSTNNGVGPLECLHCGIFFKDKTLHFLHKGLHSEKDVWRCNLCGVDCNEKYTFNSHMISAKHG